MQIHWAVFGARNGGHALLAASGNPAFAAGITQYTDRPGDPPFGVQDWGPVESGFFFGEHYVMLRTLSDSTAGRAGMVRSYAAYVPLTELSRIGNPAAIFERLPARLMEIPASLAPLEVPDESLVSVPDRSAPGLAQIACQLCSPEPLLPMVWTAEASYLPTVNALWGKLPVSLRPAFTFSYQFAPEHRLPASPTLIATLPELASRWTAAQILPLDQSRPAQLTTAQQWFAGLTDGARFNDVMRDYGIQVQQFKQLNLLSSFADLVARLPELNFAEARRAVNILAKYSEPTELSRPHRAKLFSRLCALVSDASADDLSTLRNLDHAALSDLLAALEAAIRKWVSKSDAATIASVSGVALLEHAVAAPTDWWSVPLTKWLTNLAADPDRPAARLLCELFSSPMLMKFVEATLPGNHDTEAALISGLPNTVSAPHAAHILDLAERRGWLRLHAATLVRSQPPTEAISRHAAVAVNSDAGLKLLHEVLGFGPLVQAACKAGASLVKFVGSLLADDASRGLPGDCIRRPEILTEALNAVAGPIREPLRALVMGSLDDATTSESGFGPLCSACSIHDASLLLCVKEPAALLARLDDDRKLDVTARLNSFVQDAIKAGRHFELAEPNGWEDVLDRDGIRLALKTAPIREAAAAGVNAFRCLPFLSDSDCVDWLIDLFTRTHSGGLPPGATDQIAPLMLHGEFPLAAKVVRETVDDYQRADVAPLHEQIRYKYQMARAYERKEVPAVRRLPKVVVATALPLEREQVIKYLVAAEYDAELYADVAPWPPEQPVFEVYVFTTGAGNLSAQGAMLRALNRVKPKFAFFVGVCGGIKDNEIGDVVYSTKVYFVEGGKEEEGGVKPRPVSAQTSEALVQLAHRVAEETWQPADQPDGRMPKATPAVIAAGEKVLAATSAEATNYRNLRSSYSDAQVVDMEAYGFIKSMHDENVKHCMVVRGVSDKLADKAESDGKGNQPIAARNAAAFLFALLARCPDILKPKKPKKKFFGLF